ncbi:MAG: hypothetical protein NTW55_08430 [Planctomycetota bacterium]|nr:hypothetical protein [Planctomycetota bacterium]
MEIFGVYDFDTIFIIAFAIFFYKAAEYENASKILWTGLSIIASFLNRILGGGLLTLISGQVVLFFAIAVIRSIFSRKE